MSASSNEAYVSVRRTGVGLLQDCVRCCTAIIDHVQLVIQASEEQVNLNGAWWQCSYFGQWLECPMPFSYSLCYVNMSVVFNASLVLCGILIAVPKHADQSWMTPESFFEDTSEAFRRGVKVIKDLDRGSAMISRCYKVLNRFAELLIDLPRESYRTVRPFERLVDPHHIFGVEPG